MKQLLLAGVTLVSIAALAPAHAQQAGSANQSMSKSAPAQQQSNNGQQSNQASRDEIKQAQQALDEKGFKVNADGVLGSQTKQALSKFQQQQGLQQTGQLDQETLSALGISQAGSTTGQGGSSYGNNNNNASGQKNLQQPSSGMQK